METAKKNLFINQGATFTITMQVFEAGNTVANTSPYTGAGQMRQHYSSSTAHDFTVSTGANGAVTLSMTAGETANIEAGRYVYDIELASGNTVFRVFQGLVTVDPQVTQS